nr:DsbA family protein [Deinobacterium chartae]
MKQEQKQKAQQRQVIFTVAAAVAVIAGAWAWNTFAPKATAAIDTSSQPTIGNKDSKVQVVVFEDFKCPVCQRFDQTVLPEIEQNYIQTNKIQYSFVNFSFLGPDSTTAAIAGECVYRQNEPKFFDYAHLIYRAQGPETQQWATPDRLVEIASNIEGINTEDLRACITEERHADAVRQDNELARRLNVPGTPALFVNGTRVENPLDYSAVSKAIDAALEKAGS